MKKTRGQLCLTFAMTLAGLGAGYFLRGELPQTQERVEQNETTPAQVETAENHSATIFVYANEGAWKK